ncbi:phage antirepressor [Paraburkholderia sp. DGU8]|uniref:phage antirepressor n=1 Tax=Paraburkholderia sp. DGU8 TaxID=3161997 RepID=UPI0034663DDA
MHALANFAFEGSLVRVIEVGGEPALVAKDVSDSLGYVWNGAARIEHVPKEWRGVTSVVSPSGAQQMLHLTEQGLYFFLARSDKPKAIPLQKWVAGEVLPSLRRHGAYSLRGGVHDTPVYRLPQSYPEALRALAEEHEAHSQTKLVAHEQWAMLEAQAPVVASHKRLMAANGSFGIRECAKQLKVENHAEFMAFLEVDVMYRSGKRGRLIARKVHEDAKRLEVCSGVTDGGKAWAQSRFTAKGLAWIAGRWGEYQLDSVAYRVRYSKAKLANQEAA